MRLPCASPLSNSPRASQGRGTWRKATPPRRGPFMNGAADSQPRQTAVRASVMRGASLVCAALLCTAAADARPVKISHKSAALEFTYTWPAEAAAIPALDRKFRAEAAARYRQSLSLAREDQKVYQQQKRGSIADFYSKEWTTAGESRRLLSLQSQHSAYTGGAHPNTDYGALLWDRERSREVT